MFLKELISIKTVIVSAIETVGVAVWFAILGGATFALTGMGALAIGILFVGFVLEHVASYRFRNPGKITLPLGRILGVGGVETVTWSGWLALTAINPILAAVVLFVGLFVGHAIEQNTVRNCPSFFSAILRRETIDITLIETGVAIVWLGLAQSGPYLPNGLGANIFLFVGLQVEHALSNTKARVCY